MPTHLHNFKCWYSNILDGLYRDGNAGFGILMIALPLLERYLREKSGVHEGNLSTRFFDELRRIFPALTNEATAQQFWHVYRNGLLHQVTLSQQNRAGAQMPAAWLSGDAEAIEVDASGDFWVHPEKFAKIVVQTIESDFATFEGTSSLNHPLPVVHVCVNGTSSVALVPPTGAP